MDKKKKNRLIALVGIVAIVAAVAFVFISGLFMAQTVLLTEAFQKTDGSKIMVTGNVVDDSYAFEDGTLTFDLCDPVNDPDMKTILPISYKGDVPLTFGNGVKIICTGVMNDEGVLVCSLLTINHPMEYGNVEDASTVADLLSKSDSMIGKPTKVAGVMQEGTLASVVSDVRFVIADEAANGGTPAQLKVRYLGPLADKMNPGSYLVLTGALSDDGVFDATSVALQ